jgi:hypothetical protein
MTVVTRRARAVSKFSSGVLSRLAAAPAQVRTSNAKVAHGDLADQEITTIRQFETWDAGANLVAEHTS